MPARYPLYQYGTGNYIYKQCPKISYYTVKFKDKAIFETI